MSIGAMVPRGTWDPLTIYNPGDIVTHNRSSYVALKPNIGSEPPTDDWQLLVAASPSFNLRGQWNSRTTYEPNDVVTYQNEAWICREANINTPPSEGRFWQQLAKTKATSGIAVSGGTQGEPGPAGPQGPQGPQGLPGPGSPSIVEVPIGDIDGVNTTFLTSTTFESSSTLLMLNGLVQFPGLDYTEGPDQVIFTDPPQPGDLILISYTPVGSFSIFTEAPTGAINGSNDTFTTNPFTPGSLLVFLNGLAQHEPDHYTSSPGQIVFGDPPETGDLILVAYTPL